jgi:ribosomal protein S18 acetylase RimI-like enzyme
MKIDLLSREAVAVRLPELGQLLTAAVQNGASVGFMLPLAVGEVDAYWHKVGAEVSAGQRLLFAAFDEGERLIGSAQLALELRANGRHRAEVQKVMVFGAHRGRGVGAALMAQVEAEARKRGRVLLFLETSVGESGATKFYERLGYTLAGGIPDYATDPNGGLSANAIYYKRLAEC